MFLDTNVFLYAAGRASPYREPCRDLLAAVARRDVNAATSTEVVQEVVHFCLRQGAVDKAILLIETILSTVEVIHPVTIEEVRRLRSLLAEFPAASARDLMHIAVMRSTGLDTIVSADTDFDRFSGIRRVGPLEWR